MSELFNVRNINYDFRSQTDFELGPIYIAAYGVQSLNCFALKIWNIVPIDIRNSDSLSEFTTKIKSWKLVTCPCNLCRTSIFSKKAIFDEASNPRTLCLYKIDPAAFKKERKKSKTYLKN